LKEDVIGLFHETVEDPLSEILVITAPFPINRYDLDQTLTNELDFILGEVFSQIISRFTNDGANRSMKIFDDLNAVDALLFSKAQQFTDLIQKSMDRMVTIN
jgi:hypothetical protein